MENRKLLIVGIDPGITTGFAVLGIEEHKYFGFAQKKRFEAEKGRINWARKIVEDYKKEKQQLVFE